ncbi:MAG: hypothetical protein NC923_02405 [Candidatus Omnitrophica bacterium]|nr:hypothetical protein [Candidatus Omnitrophota bacterium]
MGCVFYALNIIQDSTALSSTKANLQASLRYALDWIVKDVRQSVSWDVANNKPSSSYIKFRQVQGWDTTADTFLLSSYYLEYIYDPNAHTITRRLSDATNNTLQTWVFHNITQPPFSTVNSSGTIVALNSTDLLTSRVLIIQISGETQVNIHTSTSYTLTGEVKIRNG